MEQLRIGMHVKVVGDCNDQLLGKRGTIVGIVVMDREHMNGDKDQDPDMDVEQWGTGWRWARPEDFAARKAPPVTPRFESGDDIRDLLNAMPVEIYYRVMFFEPVIVPGFDQPDGTDVVKGDVYEAEFLQIVAK